MLTSKSLEATDMSSYVDTHFAGVTVLYDREMTEDGVSMSDLVTWLLKGREGKRTGNKPQNVGSFWKPESPQKPPEKNCPADFSIVLISQNFLEVCTLL